MSEVGQSGHIDRRLEYLAASSPPAGSAPYAGMRWVPGGVYTMGSDAHYAEEAPAHKVKVAGFWMQETTVTNRDFARFVHATGYQTLAERAPDPAMYPGALPEMLVPGALVFTKPPHRVDLQHIANWWTWMPGADWRHPLGPDSSIEGREDYPVVQVALEDVEAFASWAGLALPTEAEWEFAARGGLDGAAYVWGDEFMPEGRPMANTWQGEFPWQSLKAPTYQGAGPARAYEPNGYGLYQMAGNVWEWTADWYRQQHVANARPCCVPFNPRGGSEEASRDARQPQFRLPRRVIKGGSHLCAPNYCRRYRPAARYPHEVDTATCHVGFRCVARPA